MRHILAKILHHWPILVIILIEGLLFAANYTPGTYVVGWDNMFPELNFGLNIKRAFFGVWQEYRGLGIEDGLSHAAELPHYLFLWATSFVFPQQLLRYIFIFLMHLLGGIGMYVLVYATLARNTKSLVHTLVSLIAALFYQYNFATVQMFYLPFEVFMAHFAFLPWLLWAAISYLHHGTRKYAIWLVLLSLISTPQAHVPTVFLVYLMALAATLIIHTLTHFSWQTLKRAVAIVVITFLTNSFWGLPFAHNTLMHAKEIANSKNNQMATDDIFAKNQRYGDLQSTALMRSFSLDYVQYDHTTGLQGIMFAPWKIHIDQPIPAIAAGIFFSMAVIGALLVLHDRRKEWYPYVSLFVFSFLIIGNDVPVLSAFSEALRTNIPLFHNVFRFVFTKFFTLYALTYSILIAVAFYELFKTSYAKRDISVLTISFVVLLACYTFPSFQGNFFFRNLRVDIPKEYLETFAFLNKRNPTERALVLPAPWYWAWTQYDWGVIGSGFQWFGVPQPLVDRAFDPWSRTNETLYWQLSQAIYTKNPARLLAVLQEHHVSWIVFDRHIINASYDRAQYTDDIAQMLALIPQATKEFESGDITLYYLPTNAPGTAFVSQSATLPNIGPAFGTNDTDLPFAQYGTYFTDTTQTPSVWYPLRNLFTGRTQEERAFDVTENEKSLIFTGKAPPKPELYTITYPTVTAKNFAQLDPATGLPIFGGRPEVTIEGTHVSVHIPKTVGAYSYDSLTNNGLIQKARSCDGYNTGLYQQEMKTDTAGSYLRLSSKRSSNCLSIDLPMLPQRYAYAVAVEHRAVRGRPLSFSLTNRETRRTFLETLLPTQKDGFTTSWFVIPAMDTYGLGYSVNIDNISIGRTPTVNDLKRIRVYPIPYEFLAQMRFTKNEQIPAVTLTKPASVSHPNPAWYAVHIEDAARVGRTLILSQSYDSGWIAFTKTSQFPYIKPVGKHIFVNNWANGWILGPTETQQAIYLFFWPQLLEYLGFALLPLALVLAVGHKEEKHGL